MRSWCAYRCILGNTGRRQSEYLLISSFLTGKTIGIRQENGSKMFNIRYFFSIDKFVFSHITALHIRSIAVSQSCQRRGHDQPIYGLICARLICTLHDLLKLHPLDRITGKVKYMMKHNGKLSCRHLKRCSTFLHSMKNLQHNPNLVLLGRVMHFHESV